MRRHRKDENFMSLDGTSVLRGVCWDMGPVNLACSFIEITGGNLPPAFDINWTPDCLTKEGKNWLYILAGFHINLKDPDSPKMESYISKKLADECNDILNARDAREKSLMTSTTSITTTTKEKEKNVEMIATKPVKGKHKIESIYSDEKDEDVINVDTSMTQKSGSSLLYPRIFIIHSLSGQTLPVYARIMKRLGILLNHNKFCWLFDQQYPICIENQLDELKEKRLPVNWAMSLALQATIHGIDKASGFKHPRLITFTATKYGLKEAIAYLYPDYNTQRDGESTSSWEARQYRNRKKATEWAGIKTCEANGQHEMVEFAKSKESKSDDDFDSINMNIEHLISIYRPTKLTQNEIDNFKETIQKEHEEIDLVYEMNPDNISPILPEDLDVELISIQKHKKSKKRKRQSNKNEKSTSTTTTKNSSSSSSSVSSNKLPKIKFSSSATSTTVEMSDSPSPPNRNRPPETETTTTRKSIIKMPGKKQKTQARRPQLKLSNMNTETADERPSSHKQRSVIIKPSPKVINKATEIEQELINERQKSQKSKMIIADDSDDEDDDENTDGHSSGKYSKPLDKSILAKINKKRKISEDINFDVNKLDSNIFDPPIMNRGRSNIDLGSD